MSEVHFQIAWPDHSEDLCYSPSLVIKKYFEADTEKVFEFSFCLRQNEKHSIYRTATGDRN
jgi:uncharacterized repeat protein (TIGR04042 family)